MVWLVRDAIWTTAPDHLNWEDGFFLSRTWKP